MAVAAKARRKTRTGASTAVARFFEYHPSGPAGRWLIDHLKQADALRLPPPDLNPLQSTAAFAPTAYAVQEQ